MQARCAEKRLALDDCMKNPNDNDGDGADDLVAALYAHQKEALRWLHALRYLGMYGGLLADEMGLGKTRVCLAHVKQRLMEDDGRKFLCVVPLSTIDGWQQEINKVVPDIDVCVYSGNAQSRRESRDGASDAQLYLSSYELVLKDEESFFSNVEWDTIIVDEAHRLKNHKSQLYIMLSPLERRFSLLMTGTPIQNNLHELFSLMHFIEPEIFDDLDEFVALGPVAVGECVSAWMLRRTKDVLGRLLKPVIDICLYTEMSPMQRKLYKQVLLQGSRNVAADLRKVTQHPYLFHGMEPTFQDESGDVEFRIGDHIVRNCGKWIVLDPLLRYLFEAGHKVLLFSQSTRNLDILQDYLDWKQYSYERLDGSIRAEERFASMRRFQQTDTETFCFLLSTRAGGVGLNLQNADTVIFLDEDYNPQNDLQAIGRAWRLGQTSHVRVIRLITRNTIEEAIHLRGKQKLQLADQVMNDGDTNKELTKCAMFGLAALMQQDETDPPTILSMTDIESMLAAATGAGQYAAQQPATKKLKKGATFQSVDLAAQQAKEELMAKVLNESSSVRVFRADFVDPKDDEAFIKLRKEMTIDLLPANSRSGRSRAPAAKKKRPRKKTKRFSSSYSSRAIPLVEDVDHESFLDDVAKDISYIDGDILATRADQGLTVVFLDNSGDWPQRGYLFGEIQNVCAKSYAEAKDNNDLDLGAVHLVSHYALCIVYTRRRGEAPQLRGTALSAAFHSLSSYCVNSGQSLHFPRLINAKNWYNVERAVRTYLADDGVSCTIYYFKRTQQQKPLPPSPFAHSVFDLSGVPDQQLIPKLRRFVIAYGGACPSGGGAQVTHAVGVDVSVTELVQWGTTGQQPTRAVSTPPMSPAPSAEDVAESRLARFLERTGE